MKKTKKKKSAVALLTKRKKFSGLFFRRWIMILAVSIVICYFIQDKMVKEAYVYERDDYEYAEGSILNCINEGPQDDESNEFFYNRINFTMSLRQDMGTSSVLYNAETGEIIANCEEQIILTHVTEDDSYLRYSCATKDIEGWDEYRKELHDLKKGNDTLSESIDMDYIYIDGVNFIPGKFTVTGEVEDANTFETKDELTKTFDEPQNLSSDYVKTELTDDWKFYYVWGYSENTLSGRYWNSDSYTELQKFYEMSIEEGEPVVYGEIHYGNYELCFSDAHTVVLPTGEEAVLLTVRYYDALVQYGQLFITVAIIVFIAGILLAFVWAKLSYAGLKAQYDMIDFRNTLMNTMAHDLKSPLMSISGYAENLQNNINSDKREHYAEAILGNVNYMNRIIESILILGKTENKKTMLKKEKSNVAKLVNECDKKYDLQKKEKNLKLIVEGDRVLDIDVSLFVQAIDNLIGNAVKYASDGSAINVVINEEAISVKNNCDKMPEVDTDTLCEAFVVGNENRSNKSGSGLGLTIVKNVCELHKYGFEVRCENNEFVAKMVFSK